MLCVFSLACPGLETESAPAEPQLLLNNAAILRGGAQAAGALAGAKITETAEGRRRSMREKEKKEEHEGHRVEEHRHRHRHTDLPQI